jgi:hypothetical protein
MRVHGYFSKQYGVYEQKRLGSTGLDANVARLILVPFDFLAFFS